MIIFNVSIRVFARRAPAKPYMNVQRLRGYRQQFHARDGIIRFSVSLDKMISRNENAYIFRPSTSYERRINGVDNEESGVDRPISRRLNGKAMKYKYGTQGSVLFYFHHFLILFTCFHISVYTFFSQYVCARVSLLKRPSFYNSTRVRVLFSSRRERGEFTNIRAG